MTDDVGAVVLRCPSCGRELPGLDADRVWTCVPCAQAFEVEDGRLVARPFRMWAAPADGPVVHLPFWRLEHTAEIASADDAARRAAEEAAASGRSWIRAFSLRGAFAMGDPGRFLTEASHPERLEAAPLPVCLGARIESRDAVRVAELLLLARADRVADVTPVTLRLDVREAVLVAVPFVVAGLDVVCAVDARAIRRAALPDAEALLATASR